MADADIVVNLNGQFGYQQVRVHPSQELGSGSYGSVVKATLDHLPCAAKILHQIFFKSDDPGIVNFAARFEQECRILRDLKHPCVVQFLSIVQDPNTKGPILLMELMKESLTTFLERTPAALPYHVQVNINHDITLALAYLHGNEILHRDLSSNNILLNSACQAKVTDFGMSKMSDANPRLTRSGLMQCPGTPAFMPPEALRPKPQYTNKLDTFSAGVLMIQTITRKFPTPTDASITRDDPSSPTGEIIVPVSEMERRKSDIDKVPATHPLLPIARNCLKDKYKERPTAAQLCQSLAGLKAAPAYGESLAGLKAAPAYGESATESQAQNTSRDKEMEELRKRLQSLEQREEQRKKPASPQQQQVGHIYSNNTDCTDCGGFDCVFFVSPAVYISQGHSHCGFQQWNVSAGQTPHSVSGTLYCRILFGVLLYLTHTILTYSCYNIMPVSAFALCSQSSESTKGWLSRLFSSRGTSNQVTLLVLSA